MSKIIFILLILVLTPALVLPQEEEEGQGQSIMDILNAILPSNPGRIIELDEKTGRLFIQDIPSNHRIISEVIKALDKEPAQVSIETRFVELKLTQLDEIAFNWGNTFLWYGWGPAPDVSPLPPESVPGRKVPEWRLRGINPTTRQVGNLVTFTNVSGTAKTNTSAGLDLSLAKLTTNKLDVFLHALEQEDKANLLSSPRVTTISGQLANIQTTVSVPYIADDDITVSGTDTIHNYKVLEINLGIKLEVKPTVGEGDVITLELHPEVEVLVDRLTIFPLSAGTGDLGWPVVDTRTASTTVQVKSGETVILGGLMDDSDKVYYKKVPLLGDVPLLGNLFRHKYTNRVKKNLLIFVTATLVNPSGEETILASP